MGRPTDTVSRTLTGLLAVVVVSVVLGIVGMHALSTHGLVGTTAPSAVSSPVISPVASATKSAVTGPVTGAHAGMSSVAPEGGNGHSMGSMVMLCVAMLAATAGALLLVFLGVRRRSRVWAPHPTLPASAARWATARLGASPPYVWQFSVIRC